ncbi:MAG: DUF6088 family protein [Cyanobacteriota bacterium]|nr:DUF6088 family protein [Cyanobacteriota bacterium]
MYKPKTLESKIERRVLCSQDSVFMRRDFKDLANYARVGRSLRRLVEKGTIVKIGYGLYAKAAISPLSNRIVPRKGLRELATEALRKLQVEVVPSSYDRTYNEGKTTQIPTGRVIGVKGRISRKIGYDGKYINFERIS